MQNQFVKKNEKNIDYTFLGLLITGALACAVYFGVSYTYNDSNKSVDTNSNTIPGAEFSYENFWHKFNTYAVVMINMTNTTNLVSQIQIDNFQKTFFEYFSLTSPDNNIVYKGEQKINPDTLFCYMKYYEPTKPEIFPSIIKKCPD